MNHSYSDEEECRVIDNGEINIAPLSIKLTLDFIEACIDFFTGTTVKDDLQRNKEFRKESHIEKTKLENVSISHKHITEKKDFQGIFFFWYIKMQYVHAFGYIIFNLRPFFFFFFCKIDH